MSSRPQASTAACTSLSGTSGLVRSPANTVVSPWISLAASSATSPSRSLMSTLAPCSASSSAVARPMPRADPVTIATLSSRTPIALSLGFEGSERARTLVPAAPPAHHEHEGDRHERQQRPRPRPCAGVLGLRRGGGRLDDLVDPRGLRRAADRAEPGRREG